MNHKEFIGQLAKNAAITTEEAAAQAEALTLLMTQRLQDNDQINISGFGVFEKKLKKERISVNPKSGQRSLVPPKLTLTFRPSTLMKEKFKE